MVCDIAIWSCLCWVIVPFLGCYCPLWILGKCGDCGCLHGLVKDTKECDGLGAKTERDSGKELGVTDCIKDGVFREPS